MTDLALIIPDSITVDSLFSAGPVADIGLGPDGDLVTDDGLRTAIVISLLTDARAEADDELPAGETDRRGWWGDAVAAVPGDVDGSRLWLLARELQSEATRQLAEHRARAALTWLTEDGHATSLTVRASWPAPGCLLIDGVAQTPRGPVPFSARLGEA